MRQKLKIGIITFHRAANYGAMLQCFALKTILKLLGYDSVEVIDYRNQAIENYYNYKWSACLRNISFSPSGLKRLLCSTLYTYLCKRRLHNFRLFENKYLIPSKLPYYNYDYIIFGSDQIWNVGITQDDDTYFGKVDAEKVKKISYAGSLGHGDLEAFKSKIELLKQFKSIGVRETKLKQILNDLGINSSSCLDPTLLLTSECWLNHLDLPIKRASIRSSLLVYCIRDKNRTLKAAKKLAMQMNLKLVLFEAIDTLDLRGIGNDASYYGPREFVRCFNEADYVITDSFHGTVFSILFHKPFISCRLNDGRDGRADSILTQLGLLSQFIEPEQISTQSFAGIDYSLCVGGLDHLRNESVRFLKESIKS